MASFSAAWSRVTGRGIAVTKTLPADLKRVTHSGILEIPEELLTPVIEASSDAEARPEIMKHVRECLAEPSGKQWRRIHAGLVLVEALARKGSPTLITETAEGRHFDLVQKLSFLEHFDSVDKRVTSTIRRKAEALRKEVSPLIESAALKAGEECEDTASTCSPEVASATTAETFSESSEDLNATAAAPAEKPAAETSKRIMILNNVVAVGHNDDTTSESEGNDDAVRAPVRYREPKRISARARNEQAHRGHASDVHRVPAASGGAVDLLGL
jgi:hypothetical protein